MTQFEFVKLPTAAEFQQEMANCKTDESKKLVLSKYKEIQNQFRENYPTGYRQNVELADVYYKTYNGVIEPQTCYLELRGLKGGYGNLLKSGRLSQSSAQMTRKLRINVGSANLFAGAFDGLGKVELICELRIMGDSYMSKGNTAYHQYPHYEIQVGEFKANPEFSKILVDIAMNAIMAQMQNPQATVVPTTQRVVEDDLIQA